MFNIYSITYWQTACGFAAQQKAPALFIYAHKHLQTITFANATACRRRRAPFSSANGFPVSAYVYSTSPPSSKCCCCPWHTSFGSQPACVWPGTAGKWWCPRWCRCPGWSSGCPGLAAAQVSTEPERHLKGKGRAYQSHMTTLGVNRWCSVAPQPCLSSTSVWQKSCGTLWGVTREPRQEMW